MCCFYNKDFAFGYFALKSFAVSDMLYVLNVSVLY